MENAKEKIYIVHFAFQFSCDELHSLCKDKGKKDGAWVPYTLCLPCEGISSGTRAACHSIVRNDCFSVMCCQSFSYPNYCHLLLVNQNKKYLYPSLRFTRLLFAVNHSDLWVHKTQYNCLSNVLLPGRNFIALVHGAPPASVSFGCSSPRLAFPQGRGRSFPLTAGSDATGPRCICTLRLWPRISPLPNAGVPLPNWHAALLGRLAGCRNAVPVAGNAGWTRGWCPRSPRVEAWRVAAARCHAQNVREVSQIWVVGALLFYRPEAIRKRASVPSVRGKGEAGSGFNDFPRRGRPLLPPTGVAGWQDNGRDEFFQIVSVGRAQLDAACCGLRVICLYCAFFRLTAKRLPSLHFCCSCWLCVFVWPWGYIAWSDRINPRPRWTPISFVRQCIPRAKYGIQLVSIATGGCTVQNNLFLFVCFFFLFWIKFHGLMRVQENEDKAADRGERRLFSRSSHQSH